MGVPRFKRSNKKKAAPEEAPAMQITDAVSQNYEYGDNIPPWMNSYIDLTTVHMEPVAHRARYYATKHPDPARFGSFGNLHSTTWVEAPSKEKDTNPFASPRSSTSDESDTYVTIVESVVTPRLERPPVVKRSTFRSRLWRNRGLNADGTLRDEYDDLGMPEWGIPDDFATPKQAKQSKREKKRRAHLSV